jgi:hypothetical protein
VLVVAGGQQGGAGEQVGEGVQVVGECVQGREFFEQVAALVALDLPLPAADGVGGGGQGGALAAADVIADDAAVDAAGAGVVAAAAAAGFPGHREVSCGARAGDGAGGARAGRTGGHGRHGRRGPSELSATSREMQED